MAHYYKRFWDETRGDEFASWGTILFYFEVGDDGFAMRQMEIYESDNTLQYDDPDYEDKYGFLTYAEFDFEEFVSFAISKEEFEAAWTSHIPLNR